MKHIPKDERIIVALDIDSREGEKKILDTLYPTIKFFKVGFQLFTAEGPEALRAVTARGAKAFLDLKYHDIPTTVARAVREAVKLGAYFIDIHVQGGVAMMQAAVAAAEDESQARGIPRPKLIGITVLTSLEDKELFDLGIKKNLKNQVIYLAQLAQKAGLDGVVASAQEAQAIRWACGDDFLIVTPGIRFAHDDKKDQKRTMTPREAFAAGADHIVVGRSILNAPDPAAVVGEALASLQ